MIKSGPASKPRRPLHPPKKVPSRWNKPFSHILNKLQDQLYKTVHLSMFEPSGLTRGYHFTFVHSNWRARSRSSPFTLSYIDLLRPAQATPCEIYVTSVYAGPPARFRISAGRNGPTWIRLLLKFAPVYTVGPVCIHGFRDTSYS